MGPHPLCVEVIMARSLAVLVVLFAASGCTVRTGGAAPTNFDYSESEAYDRPHATSPEWQPPTMSPSLASTATTTRGGAANQPSADVLR